MMQELSLNVLDVAQNSVRAEATLIGITVEEQTAADLLIITIADNGCGMSPEQVSRVTDPFFTSRTTRKVGLGVPFFKMAAEMTGGALTVTSEPGRGTVIKATFGLTHIDRMPMGDIAGTVCSLIQCSPDIDFTYTFRHDGREFTADTREFREALEGVPLSNAEVLGFIGASIRENTQDLLEGGASD